MHLLFAQGHERVLHPCGIGNARDDEARVLIDP